MSAKPLRVAVVGAGHLGRIHARIWKELEGAQLLGIADERAERAKEVADKLGVPSFGAAEELPADLDAVSVATPTSSHASVAIPFLERGTAVLIEKPIAGTLADADALLAASRSGNAVLSVGHSERFNPGVRAFTDLGIRPRFVEVHRLAPFSFRSQDVGVVLDLMIHDLDLLMHLVDAEVVDVEAYGGAVLTASEDIANARLRFRNGCVANVTASRVSLEPMRRMRFFSPDSYVSLDLGKRYALAVRKGPKWESERARLAEVDPASLTDPRAFVFGGLLDVREQRFSSEEEPLRSEIVAFAAAVRGEGPNPCSGEEGRRALALSVRIVEAMDRRAWGG